MTLSIRPLVPKHPGPGTSLWKVRRTTFSRTSELGSLVRYKPPAIQVPAKFCSSLWGRCIGWGWGSGGVKGWLGGRKHGGGGDGKGVAGWEGRAMFVPKTFREGQGRREKDREGTKDWNPYHLRRPPTCPTASRAQVVSSRYPLFESSSYPQPCCTYLGRSCFSDSRYFLHADLQFPPVLGFGLQRAPV